ncbi:hypothetical protein [Pseudanabaena sp. Chao 1811]|uniref:hypothetical protein n=1 Tax=Pseudanabaena sp. Chao 1811 TaxID=2963092 RepID=UPI0022F39931|nr:hypothetical protein [Pseudanabaena sp. Chao 1811]
MTSGTLFGYVSKENRKIWKAPHKLEQCLAKESVRLEDGERESEISELEMEIRQA